MHVNVQMGFSVATLSQHPKNDSSEAEEDERSDGSLDSVKKEFKNETGFNQK